MKNQIRDIELIEKELNRSQIGILALIIEHDSIVQVPVRYLYYDKNLYFFYKSDDEVFSRIPFAADLSFTVLKNSKSKNLADEKNFSTTITISGSVKFVDEQKVIDELRNHYNKKYKISKDEELKIIMIDTQEFQAFNHTEG